MRLKGISTVVMLGALTWRSAEAGQTVSYAYDALGRLTQVNVLAGAGSGITQSYQYDAAGNRLQQTVTAPGQTPITVSATSTNVNVTGSGVSLGVTVSGTGTGGTVTFTENGTFLGIASVSGGQASISLDGFPAGSHSITATYSGDGTHAPQVSTFTIKVRDLRWLPAVLQLLLSN
jgi:YD repeat-containing protein